MIANHLWQSTLFAIAVWLITLALQKNRAAIRHRLWFAASLKFLIPFSVLAGIASHAPWPARANSRQAGVSVALVRLHDPFPISDVAVIPWAGTTQTRQRHSIAAILSVLWLCGFVASIAMWSRRWLQVRQLVRAATPSDIKLPIRVMTCPQQIEPGVFGIFHPVLLLPDGLGRHLSREQFQAVLAHEMAHVRRRDNLKTAIHLFVEALFWFHPMIRWIKARLLEEQERACDEEVLRLGGDPQMYAESILKICEFHMTSRLACVTGITGADLKVRIAAIIRNRTAVHLGWSRTMLLAGAAAIAVALPIMIGGLQGSPAFSAYPSFLPLTGQLPSEAFEAASVRPSGPSATSPAGMRGGGAGPCGVGAPQIDPQHLTINDATLFNLIALAYGQNSCMRWSKYGLLAGGPPWMRTEKFTVRAVMPEGFPNHKWRDLIEGNAPRLQAMLRTLLEDRFKLMMHPQTKEVPVYELTTAKGGPKLDWTGGQTTEGARRTEDGDCVNVDPVAGMQDLLRQNKTFCGSRVLTFAGTPVRSWMLLMTGATFSQLGSMVESVLDRPMIDKTGLSGFFSLRITFAIDDQTPLPAGAPSDLAVDADPGAPSLVTALQEKLGLKLQPAKGPVEVLIVDHAERPVQ